MSLFIDTKYRSNEIELMDDLQMKGDLLHDTLDKIAFINKYLGGNTVTLDALKKSLRKLPKEKELIIVDLGSGNGDMLREIAKYGRISKRKLKLIGIDANLCTTEYARELSKDFQEIQFEKIDIFSEEFDKLEYDIALATLFMHHFNDDEILELLKKIKNKSKIGIIINDLHRHKIAYYLFKAVSFFIRNKMVKHDGALSILRGFKKRELKSLAVKLNCNSDIYWKWAFRFQWIIKK